MQSERYPNHVIALYETTDTVIASCPHCNTPYNSYGSAVSRRGVVEEIVATSLATASTFERPEDDPHVRAAWKGLLGRLINKGGRLRLFSHRVAMFLLLAVDASGRERAKYLASAVEAFEEWRRLARGIGGDHSMIDIDRRLSSWLTEHMASRLNHYEPVCQRFEHDAGTLLRRGDELILLKDDIAALARFVATDMLDCMNALVASFEAELTDTAERTEVMAISAGQEFAKTVQASEVAARLTDELRQVNDRVRLIAINAQIEAARAGNEGRTFGVVALEVKGLSDEIASLTTRIRGKIGSI
ncbi:methyl-accepting chemotaxis protein [Sphingomonas sp. GC_Shp_4]|uniref:methyl-accepting chemotaxis protein n=1 Tax=Sphingomonas sp. GC_Shp_4 TaxID=2937382 RepID=UPI00226B62BF|nr:methyl-accepting chemotaxis protein [Sphingomonas sp. GC_Shp_4]